MAEEEKSPLGRLDSFVHARDAAPVSTPVYYGPRQMSLASRDASELVAAIADSVVQTGSPMLPEKVSDKNKARFESMGMSVTEGDMIYRVGSRYINATTTLSDPAMAFEHMTLPERSAGSQDSAKLAEYMAHHGTSGRKPWSKDEVSFNMVHGRDGDGHKALQKVEELEKNLEALFAKLESLEERHRGHDVSSPNAKSQKKELYKEILKTGADAAEAKAAQVEHQKIADEQMMPDAASLRSMLQGKLDESRSELASISTTDGAAQPGKEAEFAEISGKATELTDLLKLDDASLTGLRLYTGPSYSHMNAIGNTDTMRAWTPEQFSDNLLAQSVVMDSINRYSEYGTEESYYRAESPYAGKFEEAAKATQEETYVTKAGLTSTKEGDYAEGFVDEKTTLTKLSGVRGMKIGELSYWHGEKELLVQPSQYNITRLEEHAHHGADAAVYEKDAAAKEDHAHKVVEYGSIGFGGPRDDRTVGDSNAAHTSRTAIDPGAKVSPMSASSPASPLGSSFSSVASTVDIGPASPTASTASIDSFSASSPLAGTPKKTGQLPPMDPAYVASSSASLPPPAPISEPPVTWKKTGALPPLDPALLSQAATSAATPSFGSGGMGFGGIKLPPMPVAPQSTSSSSAPPPATPSHSGMGLGGIKLPPMPQSATAGLAGLTKAFEAAAKTSEQTPEPVAHKGPKPS